MTSISLNPEWIPKNTIGLLGEQTTLVGLILSAVAYGIMTTIFFQCMLQVLNPRVRSQAFWIPYFNIIIFALATVGFGCSIKELQLAFVDYRDFPGGPALFSFAFYASPLNLTGFVCYVLISWVADGLMLYRLVVIYGSRKWVIVPPTAVYLGFIATSICFMDTIRRGDFLSDNAINFGVAYWSMSVGLNIGVTAAIVARLLYMRSRLKAHLGSTSAELYTSVAALLIESAALYTVWAMAHIILFAQDNAMQNVVLSPLAQIQAIASLLIVFRVGQGRACNKGTLNGRTHEGTAATMKGMFSSSLRAETEVNNSYSVTNGSSLQTI